MSDEDPFENLKDDVGEREGDPFEHLDTPDEDEAESAVPDAAQPPWEEPTDPDEEATPAHEMESTADTDTSSDLTAESHDAEADPESPAGGSVTQEDLETGPEIGPPSDVTREGDPFEAMEDAFTERGVDEIDPDTVWEQLTDAKARGSVDEDQGRTYAEVSKHSYCEQCEHFSEPPDVDCTHEGTEIVEFLDMETVRLVDCPIVAERRKLEDG